MSKVNEFQNFTDAELRRIEKGIADEWKRRIDEGKKLIMDSVLEQLIAEGKVEVSADGTMIRAIKPTC